MSDQGHIELERHVDSIVIGERRRRDPGDLTPLMDSMKRVGLLQPVTITPDGYLVCGLRRLVAAKELGWSTLRVWVRSGISDELTRLLAERDDNITHKPLAPLEVTALYKEMKALLQEDAERRMKAHQFGAETSKTAGQPGSLESSEPWATSGRVDRQAAELVTGKASQTRLEQILVIERVSADPSASLDLRKLAQAELDAIRGGGAVDASYQRVKAAQRIATLRKPTDEIDIDALTDEALAQSNADRVERIKENRAQRAAAAANAKRSPRSFVLTWAELDGWTKKYDVDQIAAEVKPEDWAVFLRVLDETKAFAEAVNLAQEHPHT